MSRPWWHSACFYHLYLPSFADGNNDGFGDLRGVLDHVDYLAWLGVDAVWLSPFCRSRMEDFGYDVTNYYDVDPAFGTLDDLESLVDELHRHGLRVVMDLVVNHTSRYHPWFLEASMGPDAAKHHFYIWRPPIAGGPPNNWRSINDPETPGSAWVWHPDHGQYLLCTFSHTQPDLNWDNPAVVREIQEITRFWLDKGMDGFRLDMIDFVGKDPSFRDEPPFPAELDYFSHSTVQLSLPRTLRHIEQLRHVTDAYADRVLVGEVGGLMPLERLIALHGDGDGLDLPHNFRLLFLPWHAPTLRAFIDRYDAAMTATASPNWVLTNHDLPRITARGSAQARLALVLLLTLRGAPFLYYGEEIGMSNADIPPDRQRDPWRTPETGLSRDPSRTPMQWSAQRHAGFSTVEPWLPVTADHTEINVARQQADPASALNLAHRLLDARHRHPALTSGSQTSIVTDADSVLAYTRAADRQTALVLLNFGPEPTTVSLPDGNWTFGIGTHQDRAVESATLILTGYEGLVLRRQAECCGPS